MILLYFVGFIGIIILGLVIYCIAIYASFNPDSMRFLSDSGRDVINTQDIKFKKITLNKVPDSCKDAFTSTEDRYFYSNIGVDLGGLTRLVLSGISSQNYGGGSTISQQVIKLSEQTIYDRGAFNKLQEIIEAIKLNQIWSKDKILETYLNNIYLGNHSYGIESAAGDYFNNTVTNLDLGQCAYLAGLTQAPEVYNPYKNKNLGLARQKIVLNLMLKNNRISEDEKLEAEKETIDFNI